MKIQVLTPKNEHRGYSKSGENIIEALDHLKDDIYAGIFEIEPGDKLKVVE